MAARGQNNMMMMMSDSESEPPTPAMKASNSASSLKSANFVRPMQPVPEAAARPHAMPPTPAPRQSPGHGISPPRTNRAAEFRRAQTAATSATEAAARRRRPPATPPVSGISRAPPPDGLGKRLENLELRVASVLGDVMQGVEALTDVVAAMRPPPAAIIDEAEEAPVVDVQPTSAPPAPAVEAPPPTPASCGAAAPPGAPSSATNPPAAAAHPPPSMLPPTAVAPMFTTSAPGAYLGGAYWVPAAPPPPHQHPQHAWPPPPQHAWPPPPQHAWSATPWAVPSGAAHTAAPPAYAWPAAPLSPAVPHPFYYFAAAPPPAAPHAQVQAAAAAAAFRPSCAAGNIPPWDANALMASGTGGTRAEVERRRVRVGPGKYTPQPDMRDNSFNSNFAPNPSAGGVGYGKYEAAPLAARPNRVPSAPPASRAMTKTGSRVMSAGSGGRLAVVPPGSFVRQLS